MALSLRAYAFPSSESGVHRGTWMKALRFIVGIAIAAVLVHSVYLLVNHEHPLAAALLTVAVLILGGGAWQYVQSKHAAEARLELTVERRTRHLRENLASTEEFSQALAHDVRGPMINIREFLDIVINEHSEPLSHEARDYLNRAMRATLRVDRLTSAMLRYGELARRHFKLQHVELDSLVRGLAKKMRNEACQIAHITIKSRLSAVWGDESGITDAIREVLDNAFRFAKPGEAPSIDIWTESRGAMVRVLFRDEGIGVREEFRERIFEPFVQLVRAPEHAGIGLALAKRAVLKMHGNMGIESNGTHGSVFWIELPKPDSVAARAEPETDPLPG